MRELQEESPEKRSAAPHIVKSKWRKKFQQRARQRQRVMEPEPVIIDHYEMAKGWAADRTATTTSSLDCFDFSYD